MKLSVPAVIAALVFAGGAAFADDATAPTVVAPSTNAQTPASLAAPAIAPATAAQSPAVSPAAPVVTSTADKVAADSNDDTICETVAPLTGTRIGGGKECHARKWWTTRQHDSEQITNHHEMGAWTPPGSGK